MELNATTETKLDAALDELSKCFHENSVSVRFSDKQSDKFLSTAILAALEEWRKKKNRTPEPPNPNQVKSDKITQDNTKKTEEQTAAIKSAEQAAKELSQSLEENTEAANELREMNSSTQSAISTAIEERAKQNEVIKSVSLKLISAIGTAIKTYVSKTIDESAKRLEWVQQLNDAGVKLRGGFDETFTDLSNLSKRSHEEFTKLLTSNSNMVARLNSMGLRGEREIANLSQAIVGNYGYTVKTSDSIIKYMLDSRIKYMTEEELHSMNLSSEMDILAKNLRRSSAAFGKNTEQILAETKAREEDYTDRMLQKKYGEVYRNMKLTGLPPELIKMFLTNVPNGEAIKYLATNQGFQRIWNLMQQNRGALLNNETSLNAWGSIMNDRFVRSAINDANSGRYLQLSTLAPNIAHIQSLNKLSMLQRPDMKSANELGNNKTPEINVINSLTDLKTSVNKLHNTLNNQLSTSLNKLAIAMDGLSAVISGSSYVLGKTSSSLVKFLYSAGGVAGSMAADVLGSTIQLMFLSKAVPFVRRMGYMKGIPAAMLSTKRAVMRSGKGFVKAIPGKAAGAVNWYTKGTSKFSKGLRYGGAALGTIGTGLEFYNSYQEGANGEDSFGDYAMGALSGALSGAAAGAIFGPIGAGIGAAIGGLGSIITRAIGSSNSVKSPAQAGVQTNNYNTSSSESYTTQRIIYTDGEKESNDKAMLATLNEINRSMNYFVNNSKFQTSPMPFGVTK